MAEQKQVNAPALEPHEIEMQKKMRLLQQVRTTRSSMLSQLAEIEGRKADMHYGWVNNSDARITHFRAQGYEICKDPDVRTRWRRDDGTHVRGDVILMVCPKDLHEAWKYDGELRAIEDLENSRDSFKAFAERSKIPVTEEPALRVGGK